MKIVKIDSNKECELWEFFNSHLARPLRAIKFGDGYGSYYGIEIKKRSLSGYLTFSPGIATISQDSVDLRSPEWFSDFEDLIRRYEKQTGREVTFTYHES